MKMVTASCRHEVEAPEAVAEERCAMETEAQVDERRIDRFTRESLREEHYRALIDANY